LDLILCKLENINVESQAYFNQWSLEKWKVKTTEVTKAIVEVLLFLCFIFFPNIFEFIFEKYLSNIDNLILQVNYDILLKQVNNCVIQLEKARKSIKQSIVLKDRLKNSIMDNNILRRIIKENGLD